MTKTSADRRRNLRIALALTGLSVMLGACNTTGDVVTTQTVPTDYRLRHPIAVQEGKRSIVIFVGKARGGLSPEQHADVMGIAQDWVREGTGSVVVDVPIDTANSRAAAATYHEIRAVLGSGGAQTLRETMESILAEDVDGLELIVADHSSTDATRDVMENFVDDPRVTLLDTPAGGGAGRNWNRVTDAATGSFLKLVCGDDVLRPGVIRRQIDILESTGAVLTASKRDIIDSEGRTLMAGWGLRGIGRPMPGRDAVRKAARAGSNLFGEPASVMMRRAELVAVGGWNDSFPYLIDQATYSAVLLHGDFAPDDEVGATFRMSTGQWSVALVSDQASQARAFHRWLATEHPDVLSRSDRIYADARATMMARARRLSYRVLQRRMG